MSDETKLKMIIKETQQAAGWMYNEFPIEANNMRALVEEIEKLTAELARLRSVLDTATSAAEAGQCTAVRDVLRDAAGAGE